MDADLVEPQKLGRVAEGVGQRQVVDGHAERRRAEEEGIGRAAHRDHLAVAARIRRNDVEAGDQAGQVGQGFGLEQVERVAGQDADRGRIVIDPLGVDDGWGEGVLGEPGGREEGGGNDGGQGLAEWFHALTGVEV